MTNRIKKEEYFKPEDLAEKFKISLSSIYKLIKSGELSHIRLGKVYRIPASDLQKYLGQEKKQSPNSREMPNQKVINIFLNALQNSPLKENIREVWLYGSYARGDYDINSDIDLLIIFKNKEINEAFEKK